MEVNGIGKPLFVAGASSAYFDRFDPTIQSFCWTVTDFQDNRIQDAPTSVP